MWRTIIGALFVGVFASGCLAASYNRYEHWSFDGFWYAQIMLVQRGHLPDAALRIAQAFYSQQPVAHRSPRAHRYYTKNASKYIERRYHVFNGRPLYPFLSSLLFPRYGFKALLVVSAVAFVASAVALYVLLIQLAVPLLATFGACLFPLIKVARTMGSYDFTDMLATLSWVIALAGMIAYVRRGGKAALVTVTLGSLALVFTRPAIYLPLGAAAGVTIWALAVHNRSTQGRALTLLASAGALIFVAFAAGLAMGAPGLADELRYDYTRQYHFASESPPFSYWYSHAVADDLHSLWMLHHRSLFTLGGFSIAAIGMYLWRRDPVVAICLGVALATTTAIFANPEPDALQRTFNLPLYPIVIIGVVLAASTLLASVRVWLRHGGLRHHRLQRLVTVGPATPVAPLDTRDSRGDAVR